MREQARGYGPAFSRPNCSFGEVQETTTDTRSPDFGLDDWCRGWVWGPAMKFALESVTLVTFAAFLAWSVKIIAGWA
jgi:hypothetical protein